MNDIYLTKGDTGIGVRAKLKWNDEQSVLEEELKDADVTFEFGNYEITPEHEAKNEYLVTFDKKHTEKPGIFAASFKVKFSDGRIETFPDAMQERIRVRIKEG